MLALCQYKKCQYKISWLGTLVVLFAVTPALAQPPWLLDPHIIPIVEKKLKIITEPSVKEHLIDRNLDRPIKCPLRSELHLDELFAKLAAVGTALKYGECYNRNKEMVDGLNSVVNQNTQVIPSGAPGLAPASTQSAAPPAATSLPFLSSRPGQAGGYYDQRRIYDVLSTVSQDEQCMLNVKQRGLLPVLADVVTNVGLVASLMPTPNGLLLGAGGISLGATLRIINGLFKSPFDWSLAKDRKQFLDLNCTFFDLRRDIEAAEIIDFRDGAIDGKIARAEQQKKRLSNYLQGVQVEREAMLQGIVRLELSYLQAQRGAARLDLLARLDRLSAGLEVLSKDTGPSQVATVHTFMTEFPVAVGLMRQQYDNPPYTDYMIDLMQRFKWQDLQLCNEQDGKEFQQKYLNPVTHYLASYSERLRVEMEVEKKAFYNLAPQTNKGLKNQELKEKAIASYEKIIASLQQTIYRIDTRIQVLKTKDRKISFDAFDDGAQATYNILNEYQFIQSLLYGKLGYSYIKHFRKQVKSNHDDFIRDYNRFYLTYFRFNGKFREGLLAWACRDANQLRVLWESANASAEVANDFIDTNVGIFHSNVKVFDSFLVIFPTGFTPQYKLRNHVRSAELAKEVLNKKRTYDRREFRRFGWSHSRNLGELMLDLRYNENKREQIEKFWEEYKCLSFL